MTEKGLLLFYSMTKHFGLSKQFRLKSRKQIDLLFTEGKSLNVFPLRVSYQFTTSDEKSSVQAGFTVSKRHFKKAVDRNRIKRLMREAYRLQKNDLLELMRVKEKTGLIFFVYTDKTIPTFDVVKESMQACLERLQKCSK